jgi:hypothetical protein
MKTSKRSSRFSRHRPQRSEIDARLGSTWIPAEGHAAFRREVLGEEDINVSHAPELGLWVVRGGYGVRFSVANTTEVGHGPPQRSGVARGCAQSPRADRL